MVTKEEILDTKNTHFVDNSGHTWRRNGRVKTFTSERNKHKFSLPIKHGLYAYGYINEQNCSQFTVKK